MGQLKVVSLFAGCGGMDVGFRQAGFDVIWANDISQSACETYSRNLGDSIQNADVKNISSDKIPQADVVIGGFPCQGFSIVGTRRLNDERNFLYQSMKRIIHDKNPKFFVAENVKGLTNMAKGQVLETILQEFREIGYTVDWRILNAQDFGLPQHRERVIIIGNRIGVENPFPLPTHGSISTSKFTQSNLFPVTGSVAMPYLTLRDAIGDIEELGTLPNHQIELEWKSRHPEWLKIMYHIGEGQKLCNIRLGNRSVHTWDIPEVYGVVSQIERHVLMTIAANRRHKRYGAKDGNPLTFSDIYQLVNIENLQEILDSLVQKQYLVMVEEKFELKNSFNGLFRRLRWSEPSEAILTVFNSPRYYVHPSQDRPFSVREVARIQGFPDEFIFFGTLKDQYTQIGNAVPPMLARRIAERIFSTLLS